MSGRSLASLLFLLMFVLCACGVKEPSHTPDKDVSATPTQTGSPSGEITPSEILKPSVTEDPTPHIAWAVHFGQNITEEAQAEIQAFIYEKGIDCRIDFTPTMYLAGTEYTDWLTEQKNNHAAPDILADGFWQNPLVEAVEFVRKEFLPIGEYLKSEEGKALYEAFAEVEWEQVAYGREVYTIPRRLSQKMDGTVCLYVNNQFKDSFDAVFDGTYKSLQRLCEENHTNETYVLVTSGFTNQLLYVLTDVNQLNYATLSIQSLKAVNLTKQLQTKELLQSVYADYQSGRLLDRTTPESLPDNTMVYICVGNKGPIEGYTLYTWGQDMFTSGFGLAYGVLNSSANKELALQVISACYADPGIASLISWGVEDADEWKSRTDYLKTCKSSKLTGFWPNLTIEESEMLNRYEEDISELVREMHNKTFTGINPDYETYLEQFFARSRDYGDIFDVINEQLDAWLAGKRE